MNSDNNNKIEKYLMGQLSKTERAAFLQELQENEELRKAFAIEQRLHQGIKVEGRKELKATLNEIHNRLDPAIDPPSVPKSKRKILWPLLVAASLLLIFSLFWLLNQTPSPDDLFAQNYQAYELSLALRDGAPTTDLVAANELYRSGKYLEAIPFFQNLTASDTKKYLWRMGLAISYLETEQLEKAATELSVIYTANDPLLKDQAAWYLAMLALKKNDLSLTKSYLTPLADNAKADHHREAAALLKKIK